TGGKFGARRVFIEVIVIGMVFVLERIKRIVITERNGTLEGVTKSSGHKNIGSHSESRGTEATRNGLAVAQGGTSKIRNEAIIGDDDVVSGCIDLYVTVGSGPGRAGFPHEKDFLEESSDAGRIDVDQQTKLEFSGCGG